MPQGGPVIVVSSVQLGGERASAGARGLNSWGPASAHLKLLLDRPPQHASLGRPRVSSSPEEIDGFSGACGDKPLTWPATGHA